MSQQHFHTEITDRASFAKFLGELLSSLHNEKNLWENDTLQKFLEAMHAYTIDLQGYYNNMEPGESADKASWKVFADILRGAAMYE